MPQYSYVNYTANGSTTQFAIPFAYLAQSHVRVYVNNVEKLLGVDFTLNTTTNKVVFGTAPLASSVVSIKRLTPRATNERTVDFSSGAGLKEQDLDDSALQNLYISQELLDTSGYTLRGDVNDGAINEIPSKTSRAGKVQAYDSTGQPVVVTKEEISLGATTEAVAAQAAAAAAAASAAAAQAQATASAAEAAAIAATKVSKSGDTMTGALVVPAGASGTQVPQVQEVIKKSGDTLTGALEYALPVTLTSAAITDIGAAISNRLIVGGSATITSLGTIPYATRFVRFTSTATLTHNATSLILPGAADITTASGDNGIFISDGSGNWRCISYQRASLLASAASTSEATDGTVNNRVLTPLRLREAFNATASTAPVYAARAWINFNGTGTPSAVGVGNFSSITDNGVGDYTLNFTTNVGSFQNYAVVAMAKGTAGGGTAAAAVELESSTALANGSFRLSVKGSSGTRIDVSVISVAVFL